jgi:hypothetical protein
MHNILRLRRSALKATERRISTGSRNVSSHSRVNLIPAGPSKKGIPNAHTAINQSQWCRHKSDSARSTKGPSDSKAPSSSGQLSPASTSNTASAHSSHPPPNSEPTIFDAPTSSAAFRSGTAPGTAPSQHTSPGAPDATIVEGPSITSETPAAEENMSKAQASADATATSLRLDKERLRQLVDKSDDFMPSEVEEALQELESDLSEFQGEQLSEEGFQDVMQLMEGKILNSKTQKRTSVSNLHFLISLIC